MQLIGAVVALAFAVCACGSGVGLRHGPGLGPDAQRREPTAERVQPEARGAVLNWTQRLTTVDDAAGVLVLPDSSGGVVVVARVGPLGLPASLGDTPLQAVAFDAQGHVRYSVAYGSVLAPRDRESRAACLGDDAGLVVVGTQVIDDGEGRYSHEAVFLERYDARGHLVNRREYPAKYSNAMAVFPMTHGRVGLMLEVGFEVRLGSQVLREANATADIIPQAGTWFWAVLDRRGELVFSRELGRESLWVVPDGTGVTFVTNHPGRQGTPLRCRVSGWNAERWSFEGERLWKQDLERPLEFALPRLRGGLFVATSSCSDPCHGRNPPSCPDPRPVLLAVDPSGDVVERRSSVDSLAEQLDFVLDGLDATTRLERFYGDGSLLDQHGVSALVAAHSPAPGGSGALYPSTQRAWFVVDRGLRPNSVEIARRALPAGFTQ